MGEKPLVEIAGEPMVDRVCRAIERSRLEEVYAVSSPHVPETTAHLEVPIIEGDGEGYVEDLTAALEDSRVDPPVATVVADLPLLAPAVIDRAIEAHDGGSLTVCVPTALKRALGVSVDATRNRDGHELSPAGLNVVGGSEETLWVSYDVRIAVNVNRPPDRRIAEVLADGP